MATPLLPRATRRLRFRAWREDDLRLAQGLWGDSGVTQFISRESWTQAQISERLSAELASFSAHGLQYWPVFLEATGAHVGCCGLRPPARAQAANIEKLPELGFHLLPAFWGQGLATEAARAAIELAFGEVGAKALFAGHHPQNLGSQRVLQKLGFRFTGTALYPPTGLQHLSYWLEAESYRP